MLKFKQILIGIIVMLFLAQPLYANSVILTINQTTITAGSSVLLSGNITDANTTSSIRFMNLNTNTQLSCNPNYIASLGNYTCIDSPKNTTSYNVTVEDSLGNIFNSTAVEVVVNPAPPRTIIPPPVPSPPPKQQNTTKSNQTQPNPPQNTVTNQSTSNSTQTTQTTQVTNTTESNSSVSPEINTTPTAVQTTLTQTNETHQSQSDPNKTTPIVYSTTKSDNFPIIILGSLIIVAILGGSVWMWKGKQKGTDILDTNMQQPENQQETQVEGNNE